MAGALIYVSSDAHSVVAMQKRSSLIVPAVIAGIVFLVIAIIYWIDTSHALPSFFPGHESAPTSHHHIKHGIAAFVVALACFIFAWFQSGPKRPAVT
jgi:hypothetical protein